MRNELTLFGSIFLLLIIASAVWGCADHRDAAGGSGWDLLGATLQGLHFIGPVWSF
jgi:hypothetical protein